MSKPMRIVVLFVDLISVIGLLTYNFKMFQGDLPFGRGMGDLGYYAILGLGTTVILVLFYLRSKGLLGKAYYLISLFAFSLLLFIASNRSTRGGKDFTQTGKFYNKFRHYEISSYNTRKY